MIAPFRPLRRRVLAAGVGAALSGTFPHLGRIANAAEEPVITRPTPHSGEHIPLVGIRKR